MDASYKGQTGPTASRGTLAPGAASRSALRALRDGITIVICCHNGSRRIPAVLRHLLQQDTPANMSWEVLVIDNASTDDTSTVAKSAWPISHPVPLRVVLEPRLGLTNARRTAIEASSYEIITFLDDDNLVDPGFVKTIYRLMQSRPDVGACGARIEEICEVAAPDWFDTFKEALSVSPENETFGWIVGPDKFLPGAGLSIRSKALEDIFALGFIPTLTGRTGDFLTSGEDLEFGAALRLAGWKLWRESSVTIKHVLPAERLTWSHMNRLYYGFGASGFSP